MNITEEIKKVNYERVKLMTLSKELEDNGFISADKLAAIQDKTRINELLQIDSLPVILYMRDQHVSKDSSQQRRYSYHVAWCKTLNRRESEGNLARYVIVQTNKSKFIVNKFMNHKLMEENCYEEIEVCGNCLKSLNYEGYRTHSKDKQEEIRNNFSLERFIREQWDKVDVVQEIRQNSKNNYSAVMQQLNEYPKNWREISRKYRTLMRWTCEKCGKNCYNNKGELETHHLNSNKFDCSSSNLQALCHSCHEEEHNH